MRAFVFVLLKLFIVYLYFSFILLMMGEVFCVCNILFVWRCCVWERNWFVCLWTVRRVVFCRDSFYLFSRYSWFCILMCEWMLMFLYMCLFLLVFWVKVYLFCGVFWVWCRVWCFFCILGRRGDFFFVEFFRVLLLILLVCFCWMCCEGV